MSDCQHADLTRGEGQRRHPTRSDTSQGSETEEKGTDRSERKCVPAEVKAPKEDEHVCREEAGG